MQEQWVQLPKGDWLLLRPSRTWQRQRLVKLAFAVGGFLVGFILGCYCP